MVINRLGDAGAEAFRIIWHYIYTDDCGRLAELEEFGVGMDVLSLAERFELFAVTQACGKRLAELLRTPALQPDELIQVVWRPTARSC